MAETLSKLARGVIAPIAQNSSLATSAPLLEKEHGKIDWSLPARQIYNRMRGFSPWPGAYSTFRGQTCQIWGRPGDLSAAGENAPGTLVVTGDAVAAVCGEGSLLRLETVQLEGRKRVTAREFANGARLKTGEHFGE
jgi:methionyl-tRNA formyltransferase